jgi:hypothetical protein
MAEEEKEYKNYRQVLNQGLELYFNDQYNELEQWGESNGKEQITRFLKALQKID